MFHLIGFLIFIYSKEETCLPVSPWQHGFLKVDHIGMYVYTHSNNLQLQLYHCTFKSCHLAIIAFSTSSSTTLNTKARQTRQKCEVSVQVSADISPPMRAWMYVAYKVTEEKGTLKGSAFSLSSSYSFLHLSHDNKGCERTVTRTLKQTSHGSRRYM